MTREDFIKIFEIDVLEMVKDHHIFTDAEILSILIIDIIHEPLAHVIINEHITSYLNHLNKNTYIHHSNKKQIETILNDKELLCIENPSSKWTVAHEAAQFGFQFSDQEILNWKSYFGTTVHEIMKMYKSTPLPLYRLKYTYTKSHQYYHLNATAN